MKKIITILLLFIGTLWSAQDVYLQNVAKFHENSDKFFYKIDPKTSGAEFLGELEVRGFSTDDAKVFGDIYKKAKQIGANAFALKPSEDIDGTILPFDQVHYILSLFYLPKDLFTKEEDVAYIFSSATQGQKISFNDKEIVFEKRTYTKKNLIPNETYALSTKSFLGSKIRFSIKDGEPAQYFQLSGLRVKSNPYGSSGINLKSGDIIRLEKSFAQFLTIIYREF